MTRAAHYKKFLAFFVVATLATPLIAQSASDTPSKNAPAAEVEIKTIVSGLPSVDDSPLVRSAKIAMLARERYAAEGRKSIAINAGMIPAFGTLGSVASLGPLAPTRASGPGVGPTNVVSSVPSAAATAPGPPPAVRVVPAYSTVSEVPTTSIAGSVPMSSAAGSVGVTSAASSVPISSPASSVTGSLVGP